ncbi:MAG: hypothetical protein [Caudoviricetes sp.]|nr:MAG: hypothetical protein [Caudoviricetes sp.]
MTTSINEIKSIITAKLAEVTEEIAEIQSQIDNFEYVSSEAEYDEMLDECYPDYEISGMTYSASQILKNCDPIAYRCGKSDYDASFDTEDCEEYQELLTALTDLENELYSLQEELENAE